MMMDSLIDWFGQAQTSLFESVVQPVMFHAGLGNFLEDGFNGTGWLLVGLIQLVVMVAVFGPLQRLWPAEPVTDRAAVRTDILYTLLHRLGLVRVALFFMVDPLFDELFGHLRVAGWQTFHLDGLWPGVTDLPWVSLALYLVAFDFVGYWVHRAQHQSELWWRLHSLHHSQRQMTMWTDNRNHLLDDLLGDCILVLVSQLIGIAPGQFVAVVAITQLSENFQHANLRCWFGRWGERLWVSPRFHRMHHAIGIGHEFTGRNGRPVLGGCNFGVLLPWWDMLFGTANFELRFEPTGVRDQVEPGPQGLREYGQGFLAQQWLGLKRLFGRA